MQKPSMVQTPGSVEICLIPRGTYHWYLQWECMARHAGYVARLPIPCVQSVEAVCTSYQLQMYNQKDKRRANGVIPVNPRQGSMLD
eukprot:5724655-Ditylum_brightwellii.AAC.1